MNNIRILLIQRRSMTWISVFQSRMIMGSRAPCTTTLARRRCFVVFDTNTNSVASINNRDQHHTHGACNLMKSLYNYKVDVIVVGGIGAGALTMLNQMGITVHRSQGKTIRKNLSMFQVKSPPRVDSPRMLWGTQ